MKETTTGQNTKETAKGFVFKETRSGLRPDESHLPFVITTKDVQNYLQKRIDVVLEEQRKNGEYISDVKIMNIISIDASSTFIPMLVFLPESVIEQEKYAPVKGNSIFNTNPKGRALRLNNVIFNVLSPYMYDQRDRESFGTGLMKNTLKMSREKIYRIQEWSKPSLFKTRNGKSRNIVLLIDPIRVFYDMLKYTDKEAAKQQFRINIEDCKKREKGYYMYYVIREELSPKKKNTDLAVEVEQKMRSVNRG